MHRIRLLESLFIYPLKALQCASVTATCSVGKGKRFFCMVLDSGIRMFDACSCKHFHGLFFQIQLPVSGTYFHKNLRRAKVVHLMQYPAIMTFILSQSDNFSGKGVAEFLITSPDPKLVTYCKIVFINSSTLYPFFSCNKWGQGSIHDRKQYNLHKNTVKPTAKP